MAEGKGPAAGPIIRLEVGAGPEIAGCRLLHRLGRGAGSEVFRALDLTSGQAVAFKRLRADRESATGAGAEWRERFLREAATLQRLQHPHILRLLRFGVDQGMPWMVTEWVPGGDLEPFTRQGHGLPPAEVADIGARVAHALHHAHQQGVLHRDIKPANVLFDRSSGSLRLADFGLARLDDGSATRTGVALGSPAYSAPEQLTGAQVGPAADLYALGVLLFELLALRRPFDSASLGQLLHQIAHQPPPDLAALRPGLPPALVASIHACLAKPPGQRPTDALALAGALDAVVSEATAPD